jgi:hypothetical protein
MTRVGSQQKKKWLISWNCLMMHGLADFKFKISLYSAQIVKQVYRGKRDFVH